jgi:hypothetical protein
MFFLFIAGKTGSGILTTFLVGGPAKRIALIAVLPFYFFASFAHFVVTLYLYGDMES